ncbi:hypothetical protein GCG54_00006426 [Colletotrichum gloeosporioides]|uniref:RING-type domain-containing protein n=1 Tax=Colletotrichum gloeosporioides TaxID=474922 RepID=A0A8H4CR87_COLGL|nr:uncharacterized protein GCG54_00006426 [Colletotrichum gloeosporioides]KAF3808560.1 hypothetical protein GCG54_00006426 [Colletotrichum gloeosporioides]
MANSQKHATTGVEDIVVYNGDLIGDLRKTRNILRDLVRHSRCCVYWEVLQKTYVSQCGHGMCMKCASQMFEALTEQLQTTTCPLCHELITQFPFMLRGGPSKITHSYTIDQVYEPLRLWAAENMDIETGELARSPEIISSRLEPAKDFQDDKDCDFADETMEPFHWVALLLIISLFVLL